MEHRIVYFSPAGTTRQVAEAISKMLAERGFEASLFDLGKQGKIPAEKLAAQWPKRSCLWIGTPVYCDHAVPLVEEFIGMLPEDSKGLSVPFATWGGVTSGLALPELAARLRDKGFPPVGAAKVLAVHSTMWESKHPLGEGHPGPADLRMIEDLVTEVAARLERGGAPLLDPASLDYLSERMKAEAASISLAGLKTSMPPREVDRDRCEACGRCAEICPVGAIAMEEFPVIDEKCVLCFQCVRTCPRKAFPFDGAMVEARLHAFANKSDESKETRIFT